jgi:cytochrome c
VRHGLLRLLPIGSLAVLLECSTPTPTPAPNEAGGAGEKSCDDPSAAIELTGKSCGPLAPPQLSCYLPADVEGKLAQPDLSVRQRASDIFSWQEMIALSWPAQQGRRGEPDRNAHLQDPGARVWETWKEEYEVFLAGGAPPGAWNDAQPLPNGCEDAGKVLTRKSKIADVLDSVSQAAGSSAVTQPTLTDQAGHVVHYEIRLNKVLFDYIVDKKLYDGRVQAAVDRISMPNGSLLIKAAWREVTPAEQSAYFTSNACICEENLETGEVGDCKSGATVGLVGLHITAKTASAPDWVWSTFEQVNNVTAEGGHAASFFDPNCKDCGVNQQTAEGKPTQVTRVIPIPDEEPACAVPGEPVDNVRRMNQDMKAALAPTGSPLVHYELVGTQWPISGQTASVFDPSAPYLGNTTMETFVQGTSSCIGCHATARTVNPDAFVSSDFSFTLNNAQPKPKDDHVIPWTGAKPKSAWDTANWDDIERGHEITTKTYEVLPQYATAKLHCESCHLDHGTNYAAAPWINMGPMPSEIPSKLAPAYTTVEALQARINGCFTHSMNGTALCTPASGTSPGDCTNDADMNALIAYMTWITEQWLGGASCIDPPRGFPSIASVSKVDPEHGRVVFAERCAVCHGADGQGRYEGGVYYRPALWGEWSFNLCAGMADPNKSAAFIHANMPLDAGGMLMAQDAWDLASFIDCRKRPAGPRGSDCTASCFCSSSTPSP